MPDEPSGYELQRSLDSLRGDLRTVVASSVNAQAYAAEMRRIDDRIDTLKNEVAEVEAQHVRDLANLAAERERDRQTARSAKQWAVATAVTAAGVVVAIIAVIGERI